MFVEQLQSRAREKLIVIADDAPLIEAAKLLLTEGDLLIVCDGTGVLAGVVTKTDIVAQIGQCLGTRCGSAGVSSVMTRNVVLCQPNDSLHDVWTLMKLRPLKNIPVVDHDFRPLGILHAKDILQALLGEAESDEAMLRDYVMGVGYR